MFLIIKPLLNILKALAPLIISIKVNRGFTNLYTLNLINK